MDLLDKILKRLRDVFVACANIILALMLVSNAVNIGWRALVGTAFNPVFPWTVVGFVWLTFLGFYVFVHDRGDVAVDLVTSRLPRVLQRAAGVLAVGVTLTMLVIILATAPRLISSQSDAMDMIGIPRFALGIPLFVSAALVMIVTLRRIPEIWRGPPEHYHVPEGAD
ncbi:TRAP transporter small permease [Salipiger mucosus]|uniref:TRAP transporter small permease protein n=1 Tax=Salipiger mucosus DSM 16094 TaxID=1123237 RepID=S9SG12_9RHOB|nr:TRAP transporter small permease [Salipiger mucosus]EPX85224.1 hypothetical protein Salmuc_02603 [Salipiger mucosus DSM 16094]